jgi:hypothetical protein
LNNDVNAGSHSVGGILDCILDGAIRQVDYVKALGAKRVDIPSFVLEPALS